MSWSSIPQGDKLVGDRVDLTDTLRDGTVENLLIVLESGGRIAAVRGSRTDDADRAGQCRLFGLPGDDRDRLPEEPELEDHRRPHCRRTAPPGESASPAAGSPSSA